MRASPKKPFQKAELTQFRAWLVNKLSMSRWPEYRGDTDEEIATRLGVTVGVLVEARSLFEDKLRELGRDTDSARAGWPAARKIPTHAERFMLCVEPPQEIYEEWTVLCERRNTTTPDLLRSVVHHVLKLGWQPAWLSERGPHSKKVWYFRGQWLAQKNIRARLYRLRCDLGSQVGKILNERALRTGVTTSAIARWAVIAFAEGKLKSLWIAPTIRSLYKDQARYCVNPKIIPEDIA